MSIPDLYTTFDHIARLGHGLTRRSFLRAAAAGLAAPALASCGDDGPTGPYDPGNPRLLERHRAPTLPPPPTGANALGLGGTRDGILYVPASYDPATPTPMVVAVHGSPGSSALWTGFYPACETRGMIMLALDSRGVSWDLIEDGAFGKDIPFIDQALAHTWDRLNVDPDRTALMGFSDGASYTLSLGLSNGDIFRYLVAFSPGFVRPARAFIGHPPIFISHGTSDPVLPVTASRLEIVPFLTAAGYDVTYEEFVGVHEVPDDIARMGLDFFLL